MKKLLLSSILFLSLFTQVAFSVDLLDWASVQSNCKDKEFGLVLKQPTRLVFDLKKVETGCFEHDSFGYFTYSYDQRLLSSVVVWSNVNKVPIGTKVISSELAQGTRVGFWMRNSCGTYFTLSAMNYDHKDRATAKIIPKNESIIFSFEDDFITHGVCNLFWANPDFADLSVMISMLGAPLPLSGISFLLTALISIGYLRQRRAH